MATSNYVWDGKKMACVATYTILGGDKFLNQFDDFFLKFDSAGSVKLTSLPYFPKFGATPQDIEGRADQMARNFFKFVVTTYTNRKENPMDSVEVAVKNMREHFKGTRSTFKDLAEEADRFFKFSGEF